MARLDTTISDKGVVSTIDADNHPLLLVVIDTNVRGNLTISGSVYSTTGPILSNVVSATGSQTVTSVVNGSVLLANAQSAGISLTLPDITSPTFNGFSLFVKKVDATLNTVTIDGYAEQTIDGSTTQSIDQQYTSIHITAFSGSWYIL